MGRELRTIRIPGVGRIYPEQSTRQQERAKRYKNNVNPLTGHVTHGPLASWERSIPQAEAAA